MTQALTEQVADVKLRNSLIVKFSEMADHLINIDGGHICAKTFFNQGFSYGK
jgi:hypothetical protein